MAFRAAAWACPRVSGPPICPVGILRPGTVLSVPLPTSAQTPQACVHLTEEMCRSLQPRTYTEEELNAKLTRRVQKAARRQAKQEELKRLHRAQVKAGPPLTREGTEGRAEAADSPQRRPRAPGMCSCRSLECVRLLAESEGQA